MAHTLTFNNYIRQCRVNGATVTSPYTLNNGDVIEVSTGQDGFNVNGSKYTDGSELDLSDIDIVISHLGTHPGAYDIYMTINYSESSSEPVLNIVDITSLESALTASADAIREKSESMELIDFDMEGGTGFAEAIEAIPAGGPQGEYNIIPILKEDGTQRLQITDSGSFSLKVKTITQNGSYDPTDEDVNGYSSVIVAIPTYDGTVV